MNLVEFVFDRGFHGFESSDDDFARFRVRRRNQYMWRLSRWVQTGQAPMVAENSILDTLLRGGSISPDRERAKAQAL